MKRSSRGCGSGRIKLRAPTARYGSARKLRGLLARHNCRSALAELHRIVEDESVRYWGARVMVIAFLAVTSACSSGHHVTPSAAIAIRDGASRADVEAVRAYLRHDPDVQSIHLKSVNVDGLPGSSEEVFEVTLRGTVDGPHEAAALQRLPGVNSVSVKLPRHA